MMQSIPAGCERWKPTDPTSYAPVDSAFLQGLLDAGFSAFVGPVGLFGAASNTRDVLVIHRGMRRRWELVLEEDGKVVAAEFIADLNLGRELSLAWLSGEPSDRAVAALARLAVPMQ